MNDDELKKLWQQQPLRQPDLSPALVISAAKKQTTQLRRSLNARDFRELFACAVVIIIFGFYVYRERAPIVRIGWWIIIVSTIFIGWMIVHTRRKTPPPQPGATIVESLRTELNSTRAQSRLLGSVLWWYVLPPTIGMLVATWGMQIQLDAKIRFTVVFIATDALVCWLNRWTRAKQFLPVEAQLESLLHSAETGQPLDERHVADLRPIALSIGAGNRVEPIEFQVAFWQLALYGEIGFVGIWFFLMLGLEGDRILRDLPNRSMDFLATFFSWQHLVWLAVFFLAGLLYSWLLQRLTKRAVGISALGVHLRKGQSLLLWDEIKDVRPFRVLNIRSLWLIRASGEKTIMPWTSLERHFDLTAAVVRFAPADHPIRKYLSLLTRF